MKKKEGFTLIELLAVIVILAVIALIAVPIIMNVIESSKKGAFKETTRNLYQAAEMQEAKKMLTNENAYCSVYNFSNNQESEFLSEEELDKIFGQDQYSKLQSYKYDRIEKLNVKGKLPTEGIICSCNNKWLGRVSDGIYTAIPDKNDIIVEKGDDLSSVDQTKAVIKKIDTEVTATTIKVTVDAEVENYAKIKSYEYNINGGKYQKGTGNTYTFEELEFNTEYTIGIKITTNAGIVTEGSTKATTEYALLSVTANGYTGVYDGQAHGITVTSSGATIKYGTSSGTYNLSSSPTYTNAGTYTVYYQVTKAGYQTVTGSKVVTITKANGSLTLSKTSESLSYPSSTTVTVTNNRSNGPLSCTSNNTSIATCSISGTTMTVTPGTTAGVATITVTSASTTNYNSASASFSATVGSGLLSVTANGYTGTYDGSAHGITVTSSGATIKYGTTSGTYNLSSSPMYTNVGTYTVYYQVTRAGYQTVEGSKTIVIKESKVYAVVYSDGTLSFNSTGRVDSSKTATMNVTDITGSSFTSNTRPWNSYKDSITKVVFEDKVFPTDTEYWFYGLSNLTTISNIQNLDTRNVTNMYNMFYGCRSLTTLDLSSFDTSNVTNMSRMFQRCDSLTSLDVSNFNTSNVTAMNSMFTNCSSLTTLDLSNFDTSNVTNMGYLFDQTSQLRTLTLGRFDVSKVTSYVSMFSNSTNLTTVKTTNSTTKTWLEARLSEDSIGATVILGS